jgi:dihydroorotate dehydrogenase (NAD+) catalytic subunit
MSGTNPLATGIAGVRMESPLVLASGILGVTAATLGMAADAGAAAVTVKTCGMVPRKGHPGPAILPLQHGMLNAVGLSNPGVDAVAEEIREFRRIRRCPVFASIFGRTVPEFGEVAAHIARCDPDLIEVNVSCPNVESEFGLPFGADLESVAAITRIVKTAAGSIPVSVKLTIHCPSIARMAKVAEANGADAVTAINTVGPGMLIDVGCGRPVLSNLEGGLSGPAILPLAVRAVYRIREAVSIPIIGTGGVASAEDALQLIMAGATAGAVGTAIHREGVGVFGRIRQGLLDHLAEQGRDSIDAIRGCAHAR